MGMTPTTAEIAASDLSTLVTLRAHALKGGKRAQTVRAYLQPFLREDPPLSPEAIQEYARLDAQEAHLTMALHSDAEWIKAFTVGYSAWRRGHAYPEDAIQRRGWATAALHEDPAVRALVRAAALDVQALLEGPPQDPPMVVLGSYVRYSDAFLARIPPHDLRHKDNIHALGIVEGLDTRTGMWDVRWSWFIPAFQDTAPTPPGDIVPASRDWMAANGWDLPGESTPPVAPPPARTPAPVALPPTAEEREAGRLAKAAKLLVPQPLVVGTALRDRVFHGGVSVPGVEVRNGTQYTIGVVLDGGGPGRVEGTLTFSVHYAGVMKGKVSPKEQKVGGYLIRVDPVSSRVAEISDQPWREKTAAKAGKDEANRVYEALVAAVGGEAAVDAAAAHAWPHIRAEYIRQHPERALENGFLDEPSKLNNYWRLRYAMVILGPETKAIIPATWTDAPPWEDMAKEIVGKEAWAHKPFRAAWLAALREVTLARFHAFLLPYAPTLTEGSLRGVHAALYSSLPVSPDREALARRAETYQTLSDSQVYQDTRKARPGAPEELARRIAEYRERWFMGLPDEALADWYLLRELNRQPWPLRSERDTADIVRLAWAEEVQARGIPVEGDSSLLRSEAARALAERAQAAFRAQVEATRPRSPLEQAQDALRSASQAAEAWLAGKPQWVRDSVHPLSEKELAKWAMYHTRADYQDALIKLNEEMIEAQHWYAQTPEGQAAKNV